MNVVSVLRFAILPFCAPVPLPDGKMGQLKVQINDFEESNLVRIERCQSGARATKGVQRNSTPKLY